MIAHTDENETCPICARYHATDRIHVELDGEVFSASARDARAVCEENASGGTVIALDGTRTIIAAKAPTTLIYQALGNLDDGPT